ncbi:MAG: DEAD/DEAH box helicase family protein [Firmicutes bacterium]|nr:DEAD/DEAH box helicase family protein [Bacillota bacterium]
MEEPDLDQIRNKIQEVFGTGGILAKTFPGYEFRETQQEMALGVLRSFSTSRHALIESGTGTGKSIAYLVPAILWAFSTGNRVVVSTDTINLQEQLIHKDLPLLADCLGVKFRYSLVKGRSNYVCRRKLTIILHEIEDRENDGLRADFIEFVSCLDDTPTGSRSDFRKEVPNKIWDLISSDSMSCLRSRCPWSRECYFLKARSDMEDSNILVINHHLLFSDLALKITAPDNLGSRVLPDYEYLVLDEAHNIPGVAEDYLGYKTNLLNVERAHKDLIQIGGPKFRKLGLLFNLRNMIFAAQPEMDNDFAKKVISDIDSTVESAQRSHEAFTSFFQSLYMFLMQIPSQYYRRNNTVRLREEIIELPEWQEWITPSAEKSIIRGKELINGLHSILGNISFIEGDFAQNFKSLGGDIQGITGRISAEIHALDFIISMEQKEFVYWTTGCSVDTQLMATPLDVAPFLRKYLFESAESVILTSATMTVGECFQFFKGQIGLSEQLDPPLEFIFESPFDFPNQVLLLIPEDLPDPRDPLFIEEASKLISRSILTLKGRVFILFTSYNMLDRIEERIRSSVEQSGIKIFKQGTMPRHRMLTCFREEPGVLLGADSFWQGVDVPGDALSCVILMRLPFDVPTNPVYEARMEAFRMKNIDGFRSYALPSAVIRFRQGFGRLIRSSEDRGVVLVLDNRLIGKWYGKAFIRSLPKVSLSVQSCDSIPESMLKYMLS